MTMKNLPHIGQRIMKSALAVALCMIIYQIRTQLPVGNGIPFYSALAALWCMQPYPDTTRRMAAQRSMGTLIGAAYGLLFILIGISSPLIAYLTAGVFVIPVIFDEEMAVQADTTAMSQPHLIDYTLYFDASTIQ